MAPIIEDSTPPGSQGRLVSNQTPKRLKIRSSEGALLVLSPLEKGLKVSASDVEAFALQKHAREGFVTLQPALHLAVRGRSAFVIYGLVVVLLLVGALLLLLPLLREGWPTPFLAVAVMLGILGLFLVDAWSNPTSGPPATGRARQEFYRFLTLASGVMVPGLLLLAYLERDHALALRLVGEGRMPPEAPTLLLVGRLLQWLLLSLLSLLPAQLFFTFDRQHLGTLWERLTHQLFRFDRRLQNRQDIAARYGTLLDEAQGPKLNGSLVRETATHLWPLLMATQLLALGWTLTLLSMEQPQPAIPSLDSLSFFNPRATALTFGLLGAYFHTLHVIFRGYARRDLQPKTYSHIAIRLVIVMTLAWVIDQVAPTTPTTPSGKIQLAAVFLMGILPETGLLFLREFVRKSLLGRFDVLDALVEHHEPLTNLEGLDLYDRTRLEDEGVTNIESLAHHDLVELLLRTRIPASRLLDWADQAILHLHTNTEGKTEGGALLLALRKYGIRTATDLLSVHDQAELRGEGESFLEGLSQSAGGVTPLQLRTILETLRKEDWMQQLLFWRQPHPVEEVELEHSHEVYTPGPSAAPQWERLASAHR